ncbi:hypothetical protein P5673_024511 [Acropora cervicornis]|uniref:Uncharacterized protein n=1 Tax=Acropora cervicornis TaxID=6130 RepID=A0AAD9Q3U5_ACRCE|nr:hypothetical protein P5673_024511 [Acropora cervicornis]
MARTSILIKYSRDPTGTITPNRSFTSFASFTQSVQHAEKGIRKNWKEQNVAYGSRLPKLDSGEKIPMPNVVRTVTRSIMVNQYQNFCEEEGFNPLSCSTLFKILLVREASQCRSLQGLDNIDADGATGFPTMERIVDNLREKGGDREWGKDTATEEAFRRDYGRLAEVRSLLHRDVPFVALTATATEETKKTIIKD